MKTILSKSIFIILVLMCINCTPKKVMVENDQLSKTKVQSQIVRTLIIDGENNHGVWPMTTMMMKDYLEETGLFTVDIERTKYTWQGPHHNEVAGVSDIKELLSMYKLLGSNTESVEEPKPDPDYNPDFEKYDLIINNMGWKASTWSPELRAKLETFISNGGGMVVIHAANNSWGDWPAYNKMIGMGGWGGRNTESGPYVYYDEKGGLHYDKSEGACGSHGPQYEFTINTRAPEHPIMKGLPMAWLHTKDELYDRMRGPANNMRVLASAYSDVEKNGPPWNKEVNGTGRHEPMLWTIDYGEGRIFQSTLGHMDYSMECVGFITTFQRGAEWAATGKVTQKVPDDFPTELQTSARTWGGKK